MTIPSTVWLVSIPEPLLPSVASGVSDATGLIAVSLAAPADAIERLSIESPAAIVLDGSLSETERFSMFCRVAGAVEGRSVPFILLDIDAANISVRLEGSDDDHVGGRVTAAELTNLVRLSLVPAPSVEPAVIEIEQPEREGAVLHAALPAEPTEVVSKAPHPSASDHQEPSILPKLVLDAAAPAAAPAPVAAATVVQHGALHQIFSAVARRWWLVLAVLGMVMAADVFYTTTQQPTYLARASLIISPSANVDRGSLVYSVDSLGRGRIVGTYAEVLGSELVHREALERLGYPATALNRVVTFKSSNVADTAVVQVTAESPDPQVSADAANLPGEVGIERMTGLFPVYNLVFLSKANPPMSPYRPDPVRNYSVGFIIGLVLAIVLAYAVDTAARRMPARRVARPREAAVSKPDGATADHASTARPANVKSQSGAAKSRWSFGRKPAELPIAPPPVAPGEMAPTLQPTLAVVTPRSPSSLAPRRSLLRPHRRLGLDCLLASGLGKRETKPAAVTLADHLEQSSEPVLVNAPSGAAIEARPDPIAPTALIETAPESRVESFSSTGLSEEPPKEQPVVHVSPAAPTNKGSWWSRFSKPRPPARAVKGNAHADSELAEIPETAEHRLGRVLNSSGPEVEQSFGEALGTAGVTDRGARALV